MKKNDYKVIVSLKEMGEFNNVVNAAIEKTDTVKIAEYTAMDAHRSVQDNIDWRLQEITDIYLVNGGEKLVYTIQDGFIEE